MQHGTARHGTSASHVAVMLAQSTHPFVCLQQRRDEWTRLLLELCEPRPFLKAVSQAVPGTAGTLGAFLLIFPLISMW